MALGSGSIVHQMFCSEGLQMHNIFWLLKEFSHYHKINVDCLLQAIHLMLWVAPIHFTIEVTQDFGNVTGDGGGSEGIATRINSDRDYVSTHMHKYQKYRCKNFVCKIYSYQIQLVGFKIRCIPCTYINFNCVGAIIFCRVYTKVSKSPWWWRCGWA